MRALDGANTEQVERSKTIFFPGDPAERVYLISRGADRLSRVYESGEDITVALLRENSLFDRYIKRCVGINFNHFNYNYLFSILE